MTSTPTGGASPLTLRNGFRCTPEMNTSIEDVLLAVGDKVGHANISSASRMNKAVVVFLKNEKQVKDLIESGIWINEAVRAYHTIVGPGNESNNLQCAPVYW